MGRCEVAWGLGTLHLFFYSLTDRNEGVMRRPLKSNLPSGRDQLAVWGMTSQEGHIWPFKGDTEEHTAFW